MRISEISRFPTAGGGGGAAGALAAVSGGGACARVAHVHLALHLRRPDCGGDRKGRSAIIATKVALREDP